MVIELDGAGHDDEDRRVADADRMEYLIAQGFRVVRFRNDDVFVNLPAVLAKIVDEAYWRGVWPDGD